MSLVTRRKSGRVWEILVSNFEGKLLFTIECNQDDIISVSVLIEAKRSRRTLA